jgi:hypothetical protein
MDEMTIALLAHLSAHRRLLINLYAMGFMALAKPVEAAELERKKFADAPTQAPERGSGLDPATSDMLAAMTDEAIEDLLDRVVVRLEEACGRHDRRRSGKRSSAPPSRCER